MNRHTIRALPALAALAATSACATLNQKEKGAVIGAASGAAVGAVVGNANGSTAKGAIIGAAVGGAAGAVIGHQMDQQAKEIKQQIPGAVVERVGEGLQVTFESGLLFPYDSDVLTPAAQQNLTTLASSLDKYPNTDIIIVGHTDSNGSDTYNMSLSERRAAAAVNYLVSRGVARSRLRGAGRGETEPVASNETDAGRQKNRRVEVAIYANETLKSQALRTSGQ
ncbi:MAG: OmpA family protein [Gemmatimonadaceae bacterium]|nr:OmpA family protein [Gemmatimonadaceae bacterium]NUO93703.1 OmpA family protein [Gemmatimonadaceae bacterium]NUR35887.1 OmpA family protein [Gemmatimonadaceae bacterium]NUS46431.1 OmpA family protein [Gemmatimonadaceae bacterium]